MNLYVVKQIYYFIHIADNQRKKRRIHKSWTQALFKFREKAPRKYGEDILLKFSFSDLASHKHKTPSIDFLNQLLKRRNQYDIIFLTMNVYRRPLWLSAIAEFVCLTVVNTGNRDVVIQKLGIVAKDEHVIQIFANPAADALPSGIKEHFMIKLPCPLAVESSTDFFYGKENFKAILKEYCTKKDICKNRKVTLFVEDATGQRYFVKTQEKAKTYFS